MTLFADRIRSGIPYALLPYPIRTTTFIPYALLPYPIRTTTFIPYALLPYYLVRTLGSLSRCRPTYHLLLTTHYLLTTHIRFPIKMPTKSAAASCIQLLHSESRSIQYKVVQSVKHPAPALRKPKYVCTAYLSRQ